MGAPTFSEALHEAAWLARSAMPDRGDRIDAAVTLVKDGKVFQTDAGHWEVQSTSVPGAVHTVNGTCSCADSHYRGDICKHAMAVLLSRKVLRLMQLPTAPQTPPAPQSPAPLPEARASVNVHITVQGRDCLLTLRDHDEALLLARLETLLAQLRQQLTSHSFAQAGRRTPPPADVPPAQGPGQAPQCPTHGAMKQSTRGKGWYCPHRLDDDRWCPTKA